MSVIRVRSRSLQVIRSVTLVALVVAALLPMRPARAEEYGGVEFPQGARSFADAVVRPRPGDPVPPDVSPGNYFAAKALGVPDFLAGVDDGYLSLGQGGSAVLRFTDNALSGSGDPTVDLYVFEIGASVEASFVELSVNGDTWHSVGRIEGSNRGIDIDAFGFGPSARFTYVRILDDVAQGDGSYPSAGADIDAVGAISSVCLVAAPTLSLISASDAAVTLSWNDTSGGTTGAIIERQDGGTGPWRRVRQVAAGTISTTDYGLVPSTNYAYRVRIIGAGGCESPYSPLLEVRTAPARPANLRTGIISPRSVELLWDDVSSDADGFVVERAAVGGAFAAIGGTGSVPVGEPRFVDDDDDTVFDCTTYRYRVRSARDGSWSRPTTPISATTRALPPSGLVVEQVTSRSVFLSWLDPSTTNAGFVVQRNLSGVWTNVATLAENESWFSDYDGRAGHTMVEGQRYAYRVKSVCGTPDADGNFPINSAWRSISLTTPPAAPSELVQRTSADGEPILAWIDNAARETGFVVEYQVETDKWEQLGPNVPARIGKGRTATMALGGLLPRGEYVFRVRAFGPYGTTSMYSNVAFGKI